MSNNNFDIYKTNTDTISIYRSGETGSLILSGLDELCINSNFNIKNLQNNFVNISLNDQLVLIGNNKFIFAFDKSGEGARTYCYQLESGKSLDLSLGNQFYNGNSVVEDFFDLSYRTGNLNLDVGVNISGNLKVSGTGTFNALDLNNIDSLTLSGVDINIISGNVGIGTDTPDQKLHVLKASAGAVTADTNSIAVFEGDTNSHITILTPNAQTAGVVFGSPADNFGSYLSWNHDNHSLKLGTAKPSGFIQLLTNNEAEAVRITSGGNVGIGTGSPSEKLEVAGNIKASGASFTNRPTVNNTGILLSGEAANPHPPEFPAWTGIRRYSPLSLESVTTSVPFSGIISYFPFLIKKNVTNPVACVEMTIYSTNNPKINIGIYSGHYGFENARLIASGSITGDINYTGIYRTTLNGNFPQGPYILASVLQTGQGSSFRVAGSQGIRDHFGINTGNLILHGISSTLESNTIYESGIDNDLQRNIGTGLWFTNSTNLSPIVFLEY
jgi:hypothetical protein